MTNTLVNSAIAVRPQPVGIFDPPVSLLLLPPPASDAAALEALMAGDAKMLLRGEWRFYRLAIEGRLAEAGQSISGDSAVAAYNRFVLRPDAAQYDRLRGEFTGEMAALLEAATFVLGLTEQPPSADGLDGELQSSVLLVAAAARLERQEENEALCLLEQALAAARGASPLLAAQILHQIAQLEKSSQPTRSVERYREAIALAGPTLLASLRAELWLSLGIVWHEHAATNRNALLEAVKAYQEAIRSGLSTEFKPEMYALAHNNLALAYLTMQAKDASDQLRMGIAVQSLREALKVFRRESHPGMWASAQLNLANALQYLPSSHPEDNLQQAVTLYEELLGVRNKALDPLGYARLLANQANALAHLGIFAPALEKLNEAHKLFHWHGEPDLAASALQQVARINDQLGNKEPG